MWARSPLVSSRGSSQTRRSRCRSHQRILATSSRRCPVRINNWTSRPNGHPSAPHALQAAASSGSVNPCHATASQPAPGCRSQACLDEPALHAPPQHVLEMSQQEVRHRWRTTINDPIQQLQDIGPGDVLNRAPLPRRQLAGQRSLDLPPGAPATPLLRPRDIGLDDPLNGSLRRPPGRPLGGIRVLAQLGLRHRVARQAPSLRQLECRVFAEGDPLERAADPSHHEEAPNPAARDPHPEAKQGSIEDLCPAGRGRRQFGHPQLRQPRFRHATPGTDRLPG
jgi:hypothetical protein